MASAAIASRNPSKLLRKVTHARRSQREQKLSGRNSRGLGAETRRRSDHRDDLRRPRRESRLQTHERDLSGGVRATSDAYGHETDRIPFLLSARLLMMSLRGCSCPPSPSLYSLCSTRNCSFWHYLSSAHAYPRFGTGGQLGVLRQTMQACKARPVPVHPESTHSTTSPFSRQPASRVPRASRLDKMTARTELETASIMLGES